MLWVACCCSQKFNGLQRHHHGFYYMNHWIQVLQWVQETPHFASQSEDARLLAARLLLRLCAKSHAC